MNKKPTAKLLVWILTFAMLFSFVLPLGSTFAEGDSVSAGNTYYLAADGSDSNTGAIDSPFATLTYAGSKLGSGDTLIIRAGTYRGYFALISKSDVTVKSFDGEKVTLQNGDYKAGYVGYIGASSNVTISGLTFTFDDAGVQGNLIFVDGSNGIKITNCELSRGEGGIVARQGTANMEISNCIMHDFSWPYGSVLLFNTSNSRIYNNLFYNSQFGVNTYGTGTTGNLVCNNTFYGNSEDVGGACIDGTPTNNIFRNNIFSSKIQNQDYDYSTHIDNFATSLNDFDYNFYNSTTMSDGIITNDNLTLQDLQAAGAETNGYYGDPKFLNPGTVSFQPGRGSDCLGKGDPQYIPAADMLGQTSTDSYTGAYVCTDRTDYFVSKTGSNDNAGTDDQPFATITYALSRMLPGDYLFVKAGSYDEAIAINGLAGLAVKNYQFDKPVINGGITVQNSQDISVSGFASGKTVKIAGGKNIKISNIDVTGAQIVVVPGVASLDDYEISSCFVHGFSGEGAILVYNGKNGNISNNVIYGNSKQGMLFEGGNFTNNNIYNNTLHGNGSDMCLVYANSIGNPVNNTFKNNIFSNGFQFGNDDFFTTNTFDYNCYDKSTMTDTIGYSNVYQDGSYVTTLYPTLDDLKAKGVEQNGILGDPAFLNPVNNDFRLRANSDCVGRGTSDGAPAVDILGLTRSGLIDIGAYKFTGIVNEYYVAGNGDDSNIGTADAPFKTIQHAVDKMASGETVYVKGGIYNQQVAISNKKGNAASICTIKAVPGETPVLSSGNSLDTAISIDSGSSYWVIEGLTIQDYAKDGIDIRGGSDNVSLSDINITGAGENGISVESSNNTALQNIKVKNTKNGFAISQATGLTMDKIMSDNATDAAAALSASTGKISASLFVNSKTGLDLTDSNGIVIYNNDFYGNTQSDLKIGQNSTGNVVKNNIFGSAESLYSLELADMNNDLDYNCYNKKNGDSAVCYASELTMKAFQDLGKEANGINADPMYTEPANGNFLLQAYSPCADKGLKDANTPDTGYDGYKFEIPMDIGAMFSPFSMNVYYVATTGDDNNDGSMAHPWKTLSKGMSSLKASDTLYIRGGVYNERINITGQNGRPYAYITVKNFPGEEVKLDSDFSQNVGIKFTDSSYWRIDGLKFTRYVGAGIWAASGSEYITMENLEMWDIDNKEPHSSGTEGILGDGSNYCTVRNCYIHDISMTLRADLDNGIYIGYGAHGWTFDSNRIDNTPGSGLNFYGKPSGGDDCIITNNVISNCKYGMVLTLGKGNLISNNTLVNNWEYDLYMDWWYNDSIIQNNIFYNDLPVGTKVLALDKDAQVAKEYLVNPVPIAILYDQVNGDIFRNNVVYNKYFGNRIVDIKTIRPMDEYLADQQLNTYENNIEADPVFKDASGGDFTLMKSSPCIDGGVADQAPTTDFRGKERKDGVPDIGAYEHDNGGKK